MASQHFFLPFFPERHTFLKECMGGNLDPLFVDLDFHAGWISEFIYFGTIIVEMWIQYLSFYSNFGFINSYP